MDEKNISVRTGESFQISLDSNPSTGYCWEAYFNEDDLVLENRTYWAESPLIGASGKEMFTFRSLTRGETTISMRYRRPWEEKEIDFCIFKVESL